MTRISDVPAINFDQISPTGQGLPKGLKALSGRVRQFLMSQHIKDIKVDPPAQKKLSALLRDDKLESLISLSGNPHAFAEFLYNYGLMTVFRPKARIIIIVGAQDNLKLMRDLARDSNDAEDCSKTLVRSGLGADDDLEVSPF